MASRYLSLGLTLESDLPLPELTEHGAPPAIRLVTAPGAYEAARDAAPRRIERRYEDSLVFTEDEAQTSFDLRWWDRNHFVVDLADNEVHVAGHRPEDSSPDWFRTYLTGPLLGFAARLLGRTVLHGSAVVLDGRAVGLVGHSGDGKSTLTVSLANRGARVLADDLLALHDAHALPGPRRVRLWDEGAAAIGRPDAPLIAPDWGKRYVDEQHVPFHDAPAPLAALFLLVDEGPLGLLPPAAATLALLERVSGDYLTTRAMRARELDAVADLVERVPVLSLPRAPTAARVDERADALLRALEELP